MNAHANRTDAGQIALAASIWDNEGGAPAPDTADNHYGRRIEADRSWTVYQVFTGAPAHDGGNEMTGLSRAEASDGMRALNLRDADGETPAPGAAEPEGRS